jgi:hypothetical protein
MRAQAPPVSLGQIGVELGLHQSTVARNLAAPSPLPSGRSGPGGKGTAVTDPARRLRAAPPSPAQLTLDLPGLRLPAGLPSQARRRVRPPVPGDSGPATAGGAGPVPWLLPTRHTGDGPGVPARVPVAVWAVWDADDLVGVYAQESTARADAAVLQRDAARVGVRPGGVDCLPLQVFTESQHTRRAVQWTPPAPGVHR